MSRRVRIMLWMLGVPAAVSGVAAGCANADEQRYETTPSLEDGSIVPTVPNDAAASPKMPTVTLPTCSSRRARAATTTGVRRHCPSRPRKPEEVRPARRLGRAEPRGLRGQLRAVTCSRGTASRGRDLRRWAPVPADLGRQPERALARHRGAGPRSWHEERRERVVVRRGSHAWPGEQRCGARARVRSGPRRQRAPSAGTERPPPSHGRE